MHCIEENPSVETVTENPLGIAQFLTFKVNDQDFGIEVLSVQEIKNFTQVTAIPNMPECVKGVMNLRGTVVPVVDLRSKFGMPRIDYDRFTVIVVVNMGGKIMGLVVDAVSDVLNISGDSIEAPPDFGDGSTSYILGLAKADQRIVILLDIGRLIDGQSLFVDTAVRS